MFYKDYLKADSIIFLKSQTKEQAFNELVSLICQKNSELEFKQVLNEVWQRENLASTKVASGIAIPHAKLTSLKHPIIAVGLSKQGFYYDTGDYDKVYFLIMIVSDNENYLPVLSSLASRLNDGWTYQKIRQASSTYEIYELLTASPIAQQKKPELIVLSNEMFRHACDLYRQSQASLLVVYADAVVELTGFLKEIENVRLCLVTRDPDKFNQKAYNGKVEVLHVPYGSLSRSGQIELTHLFLAARGFVKKSDKVISLYGKMDSGFFDTVMISDIESEFSGYLGLEPDLLPLDLKQEVFARTVKIINDLAYEGREGKPIGTIFILGDSEAVSNHYQQMVVNPFQGLPEAERNILDPSLEETIKEFAKLDGAFIVRGDGLIITCGSYLSTQQKDLTFQQGLGARHAAAASITSATKAIAVVLSESTRKVSIFKNGHRFLVF